MCVMHVYVCTCLLVSTMGMHVYSEQGLITKEMCSNATIVESCLSQNLLYKEEMVSVRLFIMQLTQSSQKAYL